ncbi:IQ-domain 28 [Hibiscus trionum]|uniref:IQ-domain 28 n=1 Tax=Hibiscus trionum TaxID=183268 RepID=A0A9W7IRW2_HIBTR|nr:IQ-domain 28 [Hibiscus trionum]
MGKSPAKWIKTLLLGKKPSNSDLLKGKEKLNSPNKGEVLVSSKVTLSELFANPPSISAPIPVNSASDFVDSKKGIPKLPNNGTNIPSSQADGNDNAINIFGKPEDPERIRLDRAAAKAQAAIRGYLARRAFRTLKGIIRLQALVRGHLVRRQAVATLYCIWGVVKFQALARGQKVRCSDIDIELQEKHLRLTRGLKSLDPFRVGAFSQGSKNKTNNVFVQKLLASLPDVLPLRLQYGPEEPNSLWQWLRRWSSLRFWESPLQVMRSLALKSRSKQSVWELSTAKVENGSCFTLEHEKTKCVVRKVSGNTTADTVLEHPQNELEKVKRTLKQLTAKEVSKKSEVVNDKTTQTPKRTTSDAPDVSEQKSDEKMMREVSATLSTPSNLEADLRLSQEDASLDEPNVSPAVDLAPAENNDKIENILVPDELSSKYKQISDVSSKKANQRRASFPAKTGNVENGLKNTLKVPSYMSPTESVKARLRSQGSPRSAREVVEKYGLNRRYSLPSPSTDSNLSPLSSGAQRPAQVASKGDKTIRAEWRR